MTLLPFRAGKLLWHNGKIVWNPACCCGECLCAGPAPDLLYATLAGSVAVDPNTVQCETCPSTIDDDYALDLGSLQDYPCDWVFSDQMGLGGNCQVDGLRIEAYIAILPAGYYLCASMGTLYGPNWMDCFLLGPTPPDCTALDHTFTLPAALIVGCFDMSAATLRIHQA